MSIDVNVQNDLVIVTESSEDITVNVSNAAGPAGVGVPVGGSTGQVLKKLSNTNYDTYWALDAGGVPYSGATGDVDLGEYELKAGQVEFDQTPTGTAGVGVMRWNDSDGTLDLGLKGGNVTLQVGQEQILRVVNKTGADLLESQYKAVRIRLAAEGGSQGQRLAVVLAQGNNDVNSTDTIGIVTENITDNQEGFICTSGIVRGINTTGSLQGETWADGDVIYLSATTAGAITKVKPTAPNHSVVLGYVIYAHAVNGKIFVKCETGYEIGELHDCYLPTPSNNNGIFWNSTNLRYENKTVAGALGFTPISGSGATGQVAYWDGTGSQTGSNNLFWDAANARLGIGTNAPQTDLHISKAGSRTLRITNSTNSTDVELGISTALGYVGTNTANSFAIYTNNTERMRFTPSTGNVNIGTFVSDSGQRLQVQGNQLISASADTIPLTISGYSLTTGADNPAINISGTWNTGLATPASAIKVNITNTSSGGSGRLIDLQLGGTSLFNVDRFSVLTMLSHSLGRFLSTSGNETGFSFTGTSIRTSGIASGLGISASFTASSGTGELRWINLSGGINQTGGANGITRGLYVNPTLTAAADWRSIEWSNNSGWGLYGAGTANNYLGGSLGIGTTSLTGVNLYVVKAISGSTISTGIYQSGSVQSGVTTFAFGFNNSAILAAGTTLSNYYHYSTDQSTFGAGATLVNQVGFFVSGTMTSATNNFGFRGQIANATGRWNLFMDGTADNYLRGKLLINTTTVGTFDLDVNGTARVSGNLTASSFIKIGGTSAQILAADGSVITAGTNITISGGTISASGGGGGTTIYTGDGTLTSSRTLTHGGFNLSLVGSTFTNRFTAAGRLLLNTVTESTYLLDVNGTARYTGRITSTVTNDSAIVIDLSAYLTFGTAGTNILSGAAQNIIGGGTLGFAIRYGTGIVLGTGTQGYHYITNNNALFTAGVGGVDLAALVNSSAVLQANSTTRGFLPPRMTTTQKNAIGTPAAGLMVFDTTLAKLCVYSGTAWETITSI